MASRRTLCLGDAQIYSSSEVEDTDEGDDADVVWSVSFSESCLVSHVRWFLGWLCS